MVMPQVNLTYDLLNSNKILYHFGKMYEDIAKGRTNFNPIAVEIHPTAMCNHHCIHCSYKERNECRNTLSAKVMEQLIDSVIHMGGGSSIFFRRRRADFIS